MTLLLIYCVLRSAKFRHLLAAVDDALVRDVYRDVIRLLLTIFATPVFLPAATAELSYSLLGLLKSSLCSRLGEERTLPLMYTYNDLFDFNSLAADVNIS
jgi:hypothetical protein